MPSGRASGRGTGRRRAGCSRRRSRCPRACRSWRGSRTRARRRCRRGPPRPPRRDRRRALPSTRAASGSRVSSRHSVGPDHAGEDLRPADVDADHMVGAHRCDAGMRWDFSSECSASTRRIVPERERMTIDSVIASPAWTHAVQERAGRDAGRGDEDVLAAHQIAGGQDLVDVVAGVLELLPFLVVPRPECACIAAAEALDRSTRRARPPACRRCPSRGRSRPCCRARPRSPARRRRRGSGAPARPAARRSAISFSCRSRSSTYDDEVAPATCPSPRDTLRTFSAGDALMSIASTASAPVTILFM